MISQGGRIDAAEAGAVVTQCIESGSSLLLLDSAALPTEFYDLRNGVRGVIVQRAAQYGIRLAVVIADVEIRSDSFQAFAREANRGGCLHVARNRANAIRWLESGGV